MSLRLVDFRCLAILALVGCGGSTSVDLTPDGGAGGDDGSAAANDASLTDSSPADAASTFDANGPPVFTSDGGAPLDAGPGGNTTSIACGSTTCALPAQTCCVYPFANPPPDFSYSCATGAGCPDAGGGGGGGGGNVTALKCSGAANCPASTVCCVSQTNAGTSSDCQTACTKNQAQLCDPAAMPSGCAGDAGACSNANIGDWGLPGSFGTCGGKGN